MAENTNFELLAEPDTRWTIPAGTQKLSVLVVAAGGGGAPGLGSSGGGGGAGGLVFVEDFLKNSGASPGQEIVLRVGLPQGPVDMRQARQGLPGEDSAFGSLLALGGGAGGRQSEKGHGATPGGSSGGGFSGEEGIPAQALQPTTSGIGMGFGHPGDAEPRGSGGGGAGGLGTAIKKGGGGSGLQGVPRKEFLDPATGFVIEGYDPENSEHHQALFRDLFGAEVGDGSWFAGGGANNAPFHNDQGGRGGGSRRDGLPHTGGGGGGSTHEFEGSEPGVGGSGAVWVRCVAADGSAQVFGWGRQQPAHLALRSPQYLIDLGEYEQARSALGAIVHPELLPPSDRAKILRAYAQIALGELQEAEAIRLFAEALELDRPPGS